MYDSIKARFWSKVDRSGGPDACWIWLGTCTPKGYGQLSIKHRMYYAHRISRALAGQPIPKGLQTRHTCDNPPCVNPAHLLDGTNLQNAQDRVARGRNAPASATTRWGSTNGLARLTEAQVQTIRQQLANGMSRATLARLYGVGYMAIHDIMIRRTWRHLP